jgi:predicted unusual protein kinase regulating ubiquinone biosynthesis (AarF/ABC1/UbiB family)
MSQLPEPPGVESAASPSLSWRYWRMLLFFARAFGSFFFFDLLCDRTGLRFLRPEPIARWRGHARRYRHLAVTWGGVWIKLGQYLSTRVDILPMAVVRELRGLQDEVPAAPFGEIKLAIEREFRRPLEQTFATFMEKPLGAASFAQVHEAQLPDGQPVVVKVLRPGIEEMVEVDLRALSRALSWLRLWPAVTRRVDLAWIEQEFAFTTRRELDLRAEADHVRRFAANFAADPGIHIPEVHREFSTCRALTEENVAYIKISDLGRLRAAGIDPREVASRLYRSYMEQIFVHNFVHADPHPGNIFVRPLEESSSLAAELAGRAAEFAASAVSGEPVRRSGGAPFQLLFVDFGMVAEIPPRLRAALRKFLIGLGSRDASAVIQSLRDAGSLLPGADLAQLEEALEAVFDRFWGVDLGRLNKMLWNDAAAIWREFGQLLQETPIQVQVDLMFTGRALELLSGIATELDAEFNPWSEAIPFAQMLAAESTSDAKMQVLEGLRQLRLLAKLPADLSRLAGMAQRGRLTVRSSMAPDLRRQMLRLEKQAERLNTSVLAAAALVAGAILYASQPQAGIGLMAFAALLVVVTRIAGR